MLLLVVLKVGLKRVTEILFHSSGLISYCQRLDKYGHRSSKCSRWMLNIHIVIDVPKHWKKLPV